MNKPQIIDQALLQQAAEAAAASPRRRKNYNFHTNDGDACHRLLNAIETDSYIPPHCHLDSGKDETILVLRGKIGMILFKPAGEISRTVVLQAGGEALGINIPHGQIHALVALEPGSVFFEAKAGPFVPLSAQEKPSWAPQEGSPEANGYLTRLKELFTTT
ncbi:MAG: WbuC family cupin fold metalloprotein [Sulfuricella sp.]|jgi:cupin fold WbuC family metalloprotein|nr:WbuC family cupin fold metalloprotein [Sulfuricella sp.]